MQKKDYIFLDNIGYLDYFLTELKHKYIPVTYSTNIYSFLKERGIPAVGIFDYLPDTEIYKITQEVSVLVDKAINWFDENNRELYGQIFGRKDINFFYVSMNYLFKRFVIGSFRLIKGLEAIVEHEGVATLNYLHNGNPADLCGNSRENAFFFPDNIAWKLLESWNYSKKPPILALKADLTANSLCRQKNTCKFKYLINKIKVFYRVLRQGAKKRHGAMLSYSAHKKNILFMTPLYDLDFVSSSNEIKEKFNLIFWDIDNDLNPEFLQKQPISDFFLENGRQKKNEGEFILHELNFNNEILKNNDKNSINLYSYLVPLIKRFYERKMSNILNYWKTAKELHNTTAIDMVCWGNPPHRYPAGIVNEFFRLNNVPRFGMQHGGVYGSNYMGRALYDLDLNHCDYYFSYGFNRDVIEKEYLTENKVPIVIPVGSVRISGFTKRYNSLGKRKKRVDILYPIGVTFENIFFASEFTAPSIYRLQTKIIDKLASFLKYKVVLKFLSGTYNNHHLKQHIETLYPDVFTIIDNVSFTKSLEIYNPSLILIEQQGTPLNESLVTKSHILVYNDSVFLSFTDEAAILLQKRAIVCNTSEDLLVKIEDFMKGRYEIKDLNNTEFLEKFCLYKDEPKENITRALVNAYDKTY